MMRYNLSGRTEITQNIIRWDAPKLLERPMLIEITGTAATDPALPEDLEKTVEGPTLTIRMDVIPIRVACDPCAALPRACHAHPST